MHDTMIKINEIYNDSKEIFQNKRLVSCWNPGNKFIRTTIEIV